MPPKIAVTSVAAQVYLVKVSAARTTSHRVRVPAAYHAKLARPGETVESLVERSFEFLLEREPNTSILAEFELPLIGRYFPEYEAAIR